MTIQEYIDKVARDYASGMATEHTFRPDLKSLLESLEPEIRATNEPKRIECGAPDYVITRKDIPVGYIEAKDVGVDLDGKNLKEQFDRYRDALENLAFTDYLAFRFYLNGEATATVRIAEIRNGKVVALPEHFDQFASLIKEFASRTPQSIKSSKKLAEMMADKAKILAFIIKNAIESDEVSEENSTLREQMQAFKDILIHDIDAKAFADIYAQTIAYGMFAARLHDTTLDTFSRKEAAELIPKTNPFLRKLFQFIAAFDLDTRIDWIVDALADLFRATDIAAILKNFGKATQTHDPIMHFYETFLAEYDPKLRKSRGVFYTPEPVVNFIVRAVDDILKTEFNLPQGLADTSKTKITVDVQGKKQEQEVHRVQILDPATGTGTFLASVIKHIYRGFENQQGVWSNYVENHLIPRLNGFELLMASYAMAHLKLDLLLTDTGYQSQKEKRFQVYLTNALEEHHPDTGTLFASWLSTEANEANHIKRDTPVMVVIGNPPYSVSSSNKSEWIESLTADYKRDLNERNIQPLSDDYIKFIRFGQHFIDKNGEGILAYISNNGFIDGNIHRQMRKHLLDSFDSIYILNLHGNSTLRETHPDGGVDENVFDIKQGVSINIFVSSSKRRNKKLGKIQHFDLYGTREAKYEWLSAKSIPNVEWNLLEPLEPNYFLVPKDFRGEEYYKVGFQINGVFQLNSTGIKTHRNGLVIGDKRSEVENRLRRFTDPTQSDDTIRQQFDLKDNRDWKLAYARQSIVFAANKIVDYIYTPFDERYIYYEKLLIDFARENVMKHFLNLQNLALVLPKQVPENEAAGALITSGLCDHKSFCAYNTNNVFPLYIYPDVNKPTLDGNQGRVPNLNFEIVDKIAERLGLTFTNEKEEMDGTFAPIDILDYIYADLHSPSYREKYKEFLKIDFPRVPYPTDKDTFWQLVALGGELRQLHLLESPKVNQFITQYPVSGNNLVDKPRFEPFPPQVGAPRIGRVYINDSQYFNTISEMAWHFYIGGYQPAQKWLKDRKGRTLDYEDIQHYQKIIVALTETDRLMNKINLVFEF